MQTLPYWSLTKVLLVSGAWVLLCLLLVVVLFLLQFHVGIASTGSGGIGAVSGGLGVSLLILAIPLAPPIILILAWLISRTRN